MFNLTSRSLPRNGLQVTREAYTQGNLTLRESRRRLARRVWETGIGEENVLWYMQQGLTETRGTRIPGHDSGRGEPEARNRGKTENMGSSQVTGTCGHCLSATKGRG